MSRYFGAFPSKLANIGLQEVATIASMASAASDDHDSMTEFPGSPQQRDQEEAAQQRELNQMTLADVQRSIWEDAEPDWERINARTSQENRYTPPTSPVTAQSYRRVPLEDITKLSQGEMYSIYSEHSIHRIWRITPCGHVICTMCLRGWLQQSRVCPSCAYRITRS